MKHRRLMMLRVLASLFLFLLCAAPAFAQTSAEIEEKFAGAVKAYEVERGVLMVPRYGKDGQICEAVLENSHRTESGVYFGSALTDWMIGNIVEKLIPAAERGEKSKSFGVTNVLGQSVQTDFSYDNLTVVRVGTIKSAQDVGVIIRWKKRSCK